MSFETALRVIVGVSALAAAWFGLRPSAALLRQRRAEFTQRTGAYVDGHFVAAFDSESRRTQRWSVVVFLGMALDFELYLIPSNHTLWEPVIYGVIAAGWLAALTVTRLRAAGREFTVAGWSTAVARPRRVVVADYVSWPLLGVVWVLVSVDLALGVTWFVEWRGGDVPTRDVVVGWAGLGMTVAMAVVTQLFAQALCNRPTPAVDPSHLYLQDAWRARALASAYILVAITAFLSFIPLSLVGFTWVASAAMTATLYVTVPVVVAVWVVQPKWFRRRLWRGLAPDEVLLPGQPAPPRIGAPT